MRKIPFPKEGIDLYEAVYTDGFKVILAPIANATNTKCGIYVDYGAYKHEKSIGKTNIPQGIAHFLEHRLFDTPKGNVSELMDAMGAVSNACTSYSNTVYYFTTDSDVYKPLELLLTMCLNMEFSEEKVEAEKPIIISELEMYKNSVSIALEEEVKKNLFFTSPLKHDVLGTKESIKEIHLSTLRKVFNQFYIPNNMTLIVTGKVDPDEMDAYLQKVKFPKRNVKNEEVVPFVYDENYEAVVKEYSVIKFPRKTPRVSLGIKFPSRQSIFEKYPEMQFPLYEVIGPMLFGDTSNFVNKMLKEEMIVTKPVFTLVEGGEEAYLQADFTTNKPDELVEALKWYMANLSKAVSKKEMKACRREAIGNGVCICGDVEDLFDSLVDAYANHMAFPALVESIKFLGNREIKRFLKDISNYKYTIVKMIEE